MSTTNEAHEEKHDNERATRACTEHDKNAHWLDDRAYVSDIMQDVPEDAPGWKEMVDAIRKNAPDDNPKIFKFVLAFVDGKTGGIQVMTSPNQGVMGAINLMTRAASIMAFQEEETGAQASQHVLDLLGKGLRGAMEAMDDDEKPLDLSRTPYL